jgi:uncharacterized Zn-binding protein involved in type VI secretion
MPGAHRFDDLRACGAGTIVVNQFTVYVNGRLWAVLGDIDTHGNGQLTPKGTTVFAGGLPVVVLGDPAIPDDKCPLEDGAHCLPATATASGDTFAYG